MLADEGCLGNLTLLRRVFIHWKNGGAFLKLKQISKGSLKFLFNRFTPNI